MPKVTRETLLKAAVILVGKNEKLEEENVRLRDRLKALGEHPFLKQLERLKEKKR